MKRIQVLTSPAVLATILLASPSFVEAQGVSSHSAPFDLAGVYQSIPDGTTLPGGLRNSGSPSEISLTPSALDQMKAVNRKDDPWKKCQPVGQFRMMARDSTVFEVLPAGELIIILFEDFTHGFMRKAYLNRSHSQRSTVTSDPDIPLTKLTWFGDSIAHWEKDTLVIDAVDFNDRTWLNDAGAQHSDALHTIERIRAIRGGQFLEYRMTAEDPQVLAKPYTYVRYFKKLDRELEDDTCVEELSSPRRPTAEALRHYNEGVALINSGRREAALEKFDRAVVQSPDFEEAWFNKGNVLHAVGRYEEAILCYGHAPGTFQAWCNKGQALRALGRHEAALASYDHALRLKPKDKVTWLNRGVALIKLKRDQEALDSYDRALALDQHYADAWVNKAGLLGQLKRYDEALECFDRGLRLNPSDSLGWLSKGNVLSEQERWSEAALCYEQARRLGQPGAASMISTCRQKMDDDRSL